MSSYDNPRPTSQPIGSTDLVVAKDNLITLDRMVSGASGTPVSNRKGEQLTPLVDILDSADSKVNETIDGFQSQFDLFIADAEQNVDELYQKLGIIELGNYEDLTGFTLTKVNESFSYNFQSWVIKDESLLPYTLTGSWNIDKLRFRQYTFVTNSLFESEVSARQDGDASLQSQINSGISVVSSPQSVIQYHGGIITNSVAVPSDQNAWSFGPDIELADGVSVEIGNNSTWSIQ